MGRPVTWFEVCAADHEKLHGFYAALFDWTIEPVPGMEYAIVDTGGAVGGGITSGSEDVVVYVEVDELDAHLRRAEELGGRVVTPVTEIPGMVTFAQLADPAGNTIGLVQAAAEPAGEQAEPTPKYVVRYETSAEAPELVPIHYPAHRARLDEFHARGDLLLVGTFADPMAEGSMAVFASRDAAEAFVEGDPFRLEGVISGWTIQEWHEIYMA